MNEQSLGSVSGYSDSRAQAEQYVRSYLRSMSKEGDYDEALVSAYLEAAPEMVAFLESHAAARFVTCATPDYYLELDGAVKCGRTILNGPYDGRRLGAKLVKQVRYPLQGYCAFGSMQTDARDLNAWTHPFSSFRNFSLVTRNVFQYMVDQVRYGKGTHLCNGNALVGRLLESATKSGIQLWNRAAAVEPILEKGRVMGIVIDKDGREPTSIRARKGVVLATGGFARNAAWSRKYLPSANEWTVSPRGNQGDGINIGLASGGNLPKPLNENAALWSPISEIRTRKGPRTYPHFVMGITKRGSIIVDSDAQRFTNESASYQDFGKAVHKAGVQRQYLIGTRIHLRKYGMGAALPAPYPINHLIRQGYLICAPTIPELATKIGLDPPRLSSTVERFNKFARDGKDPDFHRGEAAYDRSFGDHEQSNPCLAPLDSGPFYAIPMHAG
jgi:succinate dehydrogenase/fumarate reductase flavoprotein subunit